jgi:hypothetical protein
MVAVVAGDDWCWAALLALPVLLAATWLVSKV